jgi:hypothetical protein
MQIYRLREALPWWKTRLIYILAPVYKSSKRFTLRKRVSERTMAKDSGHYVFPSPENNTHTFYRISDRVKRERVTSPVCRIISFFNSSRQPPLERHSRFHYENNPTGISAGVETGKERKKEKKDSRKNGRIVFQDLFSQFDTHTQRRLRDDGRLGN